MDYRLLNQIWRADWTYGAKIVAIAIMDDLTGDHPRSLIPIPRIASRAGMSGRQVRRELHDLETVHAAIRVDRRDEDGVQLPCNRYAWTFDPGTDGPGFPAFDADEKAGGGDQQTSAPDDERGLLDLTTGPMDPVAGSNWPQGGGDYLSSLPFKKSEDQETNHPQSRVREAVGVGPDGLTRLERRQRLEQQLDELMVAKGPTATNRWVQLAKDRGATTPADYFDCIRWSVRTARAQGLVVNFASDVLEIAKGWIPREIRELA